MDHYLFVGHDASRTGAPIVLLHLLRWLKKEKVCKFSILLINGGELEPEYSKLATTYVWNAPMAARNSLVRRVARRLSGGALALQVNHEQAIIKAVREQKTRLVYGNTVVTADILVRLKRELNCPIICHVHELEIAIEHYFGTERFRAQIPNMDLVIAASEAVKRNLITAFNYPAERIVKIHEFVPEAEAAQQQVSPVKLREELEIPTDNFVIIASGTLDWRKSPDIFVQLASAVKKRVIKMPYFVWVGGSKSSQGWHELQYDLKRLGIAEYVKFIGSRPNPLDYLRLADIFVLTSREDPYPLVCLEAASLRKPVICFAESGGMPEFVDTDCGVVVPFLDVDAMANAVDSLLLNSALRSTLGENAFRKVTTQHNVALASRQVVEQITKLMNS